MVLPLARAMILTMAVLALAVATVLPARANDAAPLDDSVTLTVSAASDLIPAFEDIGAHFEEETGIEVTFNFDSTGQLTQQILAGAPVDVFAAANVSYIDQLDEAGLILPDTRAIYGQGHIVLWTLPGSEITDIAQLTDPEIERIAIANPDHAPYGVAAREALESAGIWEDVRDKLIMGENISDTLRLAQTGNVDVAIVALSLALTSDGAWTLVDAGLHAPISQALAVVEGTKHEPEARAFAAFVTSDAVREIMRRHGFVLPGEALDLGTPAATPDA